MTHWNIWLLYLLKFLFRPWSMDLHFFSGSSHVFITCFSCYAMLMRSVYRFFIDSLLLIDWGPIKWVVYAIWPLMHFSHLFSSCCAIISVFHLHKSTDILLSCLLICVRALSRVSKLFVRLRHAGLLLCFASLSLSFPTCLSAFMRLPPIPPASINVIHSCYGTSSLIT